MEPASQKQEMKVDFSPPDLPANTFYPDFRGQTVGLGPILRALVKICQERWFVLTFWILIIASYFSILDALSRMFSA